MITPFTSSRGAVLLMVVTCCAARAATSSSGRLSLISRWARFGKRV
jgi:hypothetical protein